MATTVREELQDEFLSTLRRGQEIALDALKSLVETIQSVTPSMPAVRVPLADRLPGPHEVVAGASDFTEHLLANQRQFVDEVITAASRLLPGMESAPAAEADEPAAKAGKPAAKADEPKAGKPAAKAGKPAAKAGKPAAK